ncbi:MAG: hypothetical protein OEV40_17410 [Acidimicrobiia bacterium]|nr:hypothetical protein [Acidimicrobiia bacterium]
MGGAPPGCHFHPHTPLASTDRQNTMTLDVNALDSISATLSELTDRITQLLQASDDDEDALAELREVERQLQASTRRLAKIVRRVSSL